MNIENFKKIFCFGSRYSEICYIYYENKDKEFYTISMKSLLEDISLFLNSEEIALGEGE